MFKRFLKAPFFVCNYSSDNESGSFACLGDTFEEAQADAIAQVKKTAWTNGEFTVNVRKATIVERIK